MTYAFASISLMIDAYLFCDWLPVSTKSRDGKQNLYMGTDKQFNGYTWVKYTDIPLFLM